ncbi:glycine cleavage system aminomethyltransferase GcvT [Cytophagaceae bacterium ABcell3]|nr:glycine cleavage system aminomethyltransferase GcvT [Cytophagaceae bacterium ABcell3]
MDNKEIDLKKTALHDVHVELGAKMVPFAGFSMPVKYASELEEHFAVRDKAGIFDVSHMGEFFVSGPESLDFLQNVISNDVSRLHTGKIQYACLVNENGGIVDDLLVYKMAENEYMLVVNAGNISKDFSFLTDNKPASVDLVDKSDTLSLLAVQGPKATEILQKLTEIKLEEIPYYSFVKGAIAGIDNVIISATGYTGAGGFELYVSNESAVKLWKEVVNAGKPEGVKPCGLGARDTLRLEKGFCLYGNDIDETTSPLEAGLAWVTKFNKDFLAKDSLLAQKEQGVKRKLVGFKMMERGIPRKGYEICSNDGNVIGQVTSGSQSPVLSEGIGLGYVETAYAKADTEISIGVRNKLLKAKVVKLPFVN